MQLDAENSGGGCPVARDGVDAGGAAVVAGHTGAGAGMGTPTEKTLVGVPEGLEAVCGAKVGDFAPLLSFLSFFENKPPLGVPGGHSGHT